MDLNDLISQLEAWFQTHMVELAISAAIVLLYFISRRLILSLINRHATKNSFDKSRTLYVKKMTSIVNFIVFAALLGFTWEVSLSGLSFYFASIFTVVGVALFANWSILSNMTASVILFFFFPYRIGSRIRIQDGDNSVEGLILDITMFYIEIETENSDIVSFPNNLAMQKASILLKDKAEADTDTKKEDSSQ
ncbi:MAG: mechanosensitive ion channel family protein [Roseivirga sp.]|nr:mechanosensitive ion channel family protein [Roseivirga sp.]